MDDLQWKFMEIPNLKTESSSCPRPDGANDGPLEFPSGETSAAAVVIYRYLQNIWL